MFKTALIATNSTTATPLLVAGTGAGKFSNLNGNVGDPLPVLISNADGSILVYLGGPDVTAANGFPLAAGESTPLSLIGVPVSDIPYAISASGVPNVAVLVGRQ